MKRKGGQPPAPQFNEARPPATHLVETPRQPPAAPESLLPEQPEPPQQQASTPGSSASDFYPNYEGAHKSVQYDNDEHPDAVVEQTTEPPMVLYTEEEEPQTTATQRRFVFVTKRPRYAVL
jgi:hypothetical protein